MLIDEVPLLMTEVQLGAKGVVMNLTSCKVGGDLIVTALKQLVINSPVSLL